MLFRVIYRVKWVTFFVHQNRCIEEPKSVNTQDDGQWWCYFSSKALSKRFPYLTHRQVAYTLNKLVEDGTLLCRRPGIETGAGVSAVGAGYSPIP